MHVDSVLVVEDQQPVREWIVGVVAALFPGARITQAATLQQAREQLTPLPDLLLVDLSLPDGIGHELIVDVKQQTQEVPCVVITSFEDDGFLFPALKAGADGYLLKDQSPDELKVLLCRILEDKPPLSPAIADKLFDYFRGDTGEANAAGLSPREAQVLKLIARGYSTKECARDMDLSHFTVAEYIKGIYRKLQVKSRTEAVARAVKLGID